MVGISELPWGITFPLPECNQGFGPPIRAWYLPEVVPDGTGSWYLPEDYAFCHRVRAAGVHVIADTSIRLSHVGKSSLTWDDFRPELNADALRQR